MPNKRRIWRWLLIIIVAGIAVVGAVAWMVGSALIAPANRSVGNPPDNFPATTIQIPSDSGTTLAAWHLLVPESRVTVILLHPIRGDRRSMLSRAQLLQEHGYSTLLVDLQAHGESQGENITIGYLEKHDVLAAVKYVRKNYPAQKIGIIGRSLGGASTLFAQPDVDLIVLESVYPTVSEAVHNRVKLRLGALHHVLAPLLIAQLKPRLGISSRQLRPIDQLDKIHCPVLIASGDQDLHTTIGETQRIFDAANEPKKLVVFKNAEHVDLLARDREKYENEIVGYINDILAVAKQ